MGPMIEVRELTKTFHMWEERPSLELKSLLIRWMKGGKKKPKKTQFTVLEDVSFDIYPGEFVGIMGRNGIGKSTILKIISGIYAPNKGTVHVSGLVAPLLELGAGFSPELSGYENIFLNAAILGFGYRETQASIKSVIDFSELRDKIHMPVKNYSSGMLVRLGFSIAAHLKAPIILLDEVLGVGDAGFLKKSTDKIHELHKQGRTIILVTHSPHQVQQHCTRCILLDNKKVIFDGPAKEGSEMYLATVAAKN